MSGVNRVLQKIQASVQAGNYYEAHQMYHSVSQRFLKQKKISDAIDLVQDGAIQMLRHDQSGSALDLCSRMIDIFESFKLGVNDETRG